MTTSPCILYAEDDEIILEIVSDELRHHGFRVWEAKNGRDAQEILKKNTPHLILSDAEMPYLNGFGLKAWIEEQTSELKQCPFVLLTAYDDPQNRTRGASLNINDYLVKPVDIEALVKTIENHLKIKATPKP